MKKIWVVSLRTSLPEVARNGADLKTSMRAFENFEMARKCARASLKKLAFGEENDMFDENGTLKALAQYAEHAVEESPEELEEWDVIAPGKQVWSDVVEMIRAICAGRDVDLPAYCTPDGVYGEYTDWLAEITYSPDGFLINGIDDGPCNGINPYISTNMLKMDQEQDYHLHIDDLFGQDGCSSELYLDVLPVDLKEISEKA